MNQDSSKLNPLPIKDCSPLDQGVSVYRNNVLTWVILLITGVGWGGSFSLAKIAVTNQGHPLGINYWQSLIGSAILLLYLVLTRQRLPLERSYILVYVVCGALGSAIPGVLYFYAIIHVSPGVLAITMAMVPVMTFIAAAVTEIEPKSFLRFLGIGFGVLSIALLVAPSDSLPDRSAIPWVFAMIIASACYAAENIFIASRFPKKTNPLVILCGMFIAATIMMTPFIVAMDAFVPFERPWRSSEWSIISLAFLSVVCYGLFVWLIVNAGPVFASQTAYLITVSGVLWGILFFSEEHSVWVWASLVSMLIALILVSSHRKTAP